ncbi:hypothetical protein MQC88_11715 [Luteimonas sp. 50]|uniref:Uncharacterized protein n=1 Tax=Cognatiluteimonas sedimenti TaxID=2927791 RepID=A0ABT0A6P1_9GAMM|nr:hypothetical protein [Lysobacter sedimenti]MCJ0826610.1 hypothetical protein [Lysobacter sedimenti]
MRCLDHVFLRGAMAVALLGFGGTGALLLPEPEPPACQTEVTTLPRPMASFDALHVERVQPVLAPAHQARC